MQEASRELFLHREHKEGYILKCSERKKLFVNFYVRQGANLAIKGRKFNIFTQNSADAGHLWRVIEIPVFYWDIITVSSRQIGYFNIKHIVQWPLGKLSYPKEAARGGGLICWGALTFFFFFAERVILNMPQVFSSPSSKQNCPLNGPVISVCGVQLRDRRRDFNSFFLAINVYFLPKIK